MMYQGYKVKVFIFAGRQQTMELLMPQIKSEYIDEIIIAKNTRNTNDLKYLNTLSKTFEKIKYIELPENVKKDNHKAWKYLYRFMQDEDSIYFKMDDDVIYIKPGYFENTLKFRYEHPEYLCIFPVIVNNPFCCTLLKVHPLMFANLNKYDLQKAYFYSGKYGARLHEQFLEFPDDEMWKIPNYEFGREAVLFKNKKHEEIVNHMVDWAYAIRPGINAICYFGKDFKSLDVANKINACYSDELFLMYNVLKDTKWKHCILGDTLVSHFAFSGQNGLRNRKDILEKYKRLI